MHEVPVSLRFLEEAPYKIKKDLAMYIRKVFQARHRKGYVDNQPRIQQLDALLLQAIKKLDPGERDLLWYALGDLFEKKDRIVLYLNFFEKELEEKNEYLVTLIRTQIMFDMLAITEAENEYLSPSFS